MAKISTAVAVEATDALEASRKAAQLAIVSQLSLDSLKLLAGAAAKPGADKKLQQYKAFL